MINAWSLAASILNGTFDKDYPIVKKDNEHSDYYYDYNRNDPDRENPFTDPKDRERAEKVVNGNVDLDNDLDRIERMGGFEWTPGSPWPPVDPLEDCNGLDYESDLMTDQYAHHFNSDRIYDAVWGDGIKHTKKEQMAKIDHRYKYHEDEILKDIQEYVSSTYNGHYTGSKNEFRKVQTIDLMAARDLASHFCQANILKYGSRYGSKDGKNKKDLMKVIHYAMLLLHFDGHYGEPSMPSGNFEQMP